MKRTQDKVKDYVEPQAFEEVLNVAADPERALAAYRFTDATSDLLTRWLDALADLPRGHGAARALAGARGVGKSHTLAVFSALVGSPELRLSLDDAHVGTSARRLMNRRYKVVRVERGLQPLLVDEMVKAFAEAFGGDSQQWGTDAATMLAMAVARAQEATLVVIIDTAFAREQRVGRDDGPILSQLAIAAQNISCFVTLALDDDIADASGVNSILAGSYPIDYLDPEHLYRVADQYLLRKNPQARAALHEMYLSLRETVPGFNWSEPRFAALYPVHPLVADVAAAVRLYAPRFAFLSFAASAAARAVSRPARSLILLDEVFDRSEYDLRHAPDLADAFAAYDDLAVRAVAQFPVMQRLQAKLVLKSLFIYSLDGRGATASELCAALLMSNEHVREATTGAVERIDETLTRFTELAPPRAWQKSKKSDEGGERYRFQISAAAKFEDALAESLQKSPPQSAAINDLLRSMARTRFSDWPLAGENGEMLKAANFHIRWRGSDRHGSFVWQQFADTNSALNFRAGDWQISIHAPVGNGPSVRSGVAAETSANLAPEAANSSLAEAHEPDISAAKREEPATETSAVVPLFSFAWRPAALSLEEFNVLRRLIALQTDATFSTNFGEKAHAAASTLGAQAERIWTRLYLDEGVFFNTGPATDATILRADTRLTFNDEARAARTLSTALEKTFTPLFDQLYPAHPSFARTFGEREVTNLIEGFFSSAVTAADAGLRQLAQTFAQPLGLAALRGDAYTFEMGDDAMAYPWVREVLALTDVAAGEVVPLEMVRSVLHRQPYGFLRETQHVILAALVAQRRLELLSATGQRLNRRTFSGTIKWEEMTGVTRAEGMHLSAEELTTWARRLTADRAPLASIAEPQAHGKLRHALSEWLDEWRARRVLEKFNELPDDALTTFTWNMMSAVQKSFGATAAAIEAMVMNEVSLEECLQRVADAFSDAPENFARITKQLEELSEFIKNFAERDRVRIYLALAELTGLDEIESARRELLAMAADAHSLFDQDQRARFNLLWHEFYTRYTDHYASVHDRAVGENTVRQTLDALLVSERWREFEALSQLSILDGRHWQQAEDYLERATRARCQLPVRQLLQERATCVCSFRLARAEELASITQNLEQIAGLGDAAYRRTLALLGKQLHHALETVAAQEEDPESETARRARALSHALSMGLVPERLTRLSVRLIERACEALGSASPVRVHAPTEGCGLLTREELAARFGQWLEELPANSSLVEIVSPNGTDRA